MEDNINIDDHPAHNAAPPRAVERNEALTFGDYTAPNHTPLLSCIRRPGNGQTRPDLQPAFIQMLYGSAFRGNSTGDPNLHLTQFKSLCQSVRVANEVTTEEVLLLAFPFSLSRKALEWLYALPADSIHTWDQLGAEFMNRFFPAHKTQLAKNGINSFSQEHGESLGKAWERFKEYQRACPHHNFDRYYLLSTFLNGLRDEIRFYISCASGGSHQKLTFDELEESIERMASDRTTPTEFSRRKGNVENVSEVNALKVELAELKMQIYSSNRDALGETSDQLSGNQSMFSQEQGVEDVNYVANNPYSNTYNPGWRNHPNFSYKSNNYQNAPQENRN
ncbi:PREDICTED: uncharacterized protein LOC104811320 [Tarenaya hassleriana]|uniref:uncharacterized protein LOC104811320 n=1 Tax=Tarenaya hassleriana TaxID=28532 RepID=UPI00053C2BCB|nr:PREDICTED: uncharacterized protein LOC104811320 [Tarenaya hassleriana]